MKDHPFNVELAASTLALNKFAYYAEQDALYLQDFSGYHAIIVSRVLLECVRCCLRNSNYAFVV
ncbi:hypothetical protein [Pajaroellobacter abortibovis]|uniref:hypothetical protein n=1 Tax=Pajaroellobacter abortibovis TaxID=1882918 RepID=UPI0009FB5191|nr:hypothetical protein [Pajaroellobacter abortibovis]